MRGGTVVFKIVGLLVRTSRADCARSGANGRVVPGNPKQGEKIRNDENRSSDGVGSFRSEEIQLMRPGHEQAVDQHLRDDVEQRQRLLGPRQDRCANSAWLSTQVVE